MGGENTRHHVSNDERREFLKALGVGSTVALGGATLDEVRSAVDGASTAELADIGESIRADLVGTADAGLIDGQQAAFAESAAALPAVTEKGLPTDAPREEFASVAAGARPIYEHLDEVGFFESTTTHLPAFTPEYLRNSVKAFAGSAALAQPLDQLGLDGTEGVDLLGTVVANAERISDRHWVATDEIPREQIEFGDLIPPMTKGAAGGVVLWLEDLDEHLWQQEVLLTDAILADAVWHARSMAAGFQLMTEGAKAIAAESGRLSNGELGALLSTGFAVQAIAQNLLAQDAYWITDEMRAPRRTDLETITER